MLTTKAMIDAYGRNVKIVKLQTSGINHAESLEQLPFRANCMNWVVGHLVTNRYQVLKLLGADPSPEEWQRVAHYERESQPITGEEAGVLPLEDLLSLLERTQAKLDILLAEISEETLAEPVAFYGGRSEPVAEWLFFFYFHDSYHTGQTEILRQAAGRDDKII